MMARGTSADVAVIALVGERGREVRSFLEHDLGAEGLKRSVVDRLDLRQPAAGAPARRLRRDAIAEYFRDQGQHVLLMMDSVTRFAMAQREVGLAAGEPPTAKGYPPSVFALLPGLLERAGNVRGQGSITGFYTVLVEGDDTNEPVADNVRAILDGHIVLSRDLGARNHYPAIDVLHSVSRTMPDVTTVDHRLKAGTVRDWMATMRDSEDLVSVGAYVAGSNPRIDEALAKRGAIDELPPAARRRPRVARATRRALARGAVTRCRRSAPAQARRRRPATSRKPRRISAKAPPNGVRACRAEAVPAPRGRRRRVGAPAVGAVTLRAAAR